MKMYMDRLIANITSRRTGRGIYVLMVLILLAAMAVPAVSLVHAATIPTFSIVTVVTDTSVTIRTYNFPANQLFTVRMGAYGTQAIGGTVVGTTNSGAGGSFEETYAIPAGLAGSYRIAIRMDSSVGGYYAYNWFYNSTVSVTPAPGTVVPPLSGIPTFSIQAVVKDTSVTILTNNFPANQTFTVRMGPMGTKGIGGTVVGTTDSGVGGAFSATYAIPAGLAGSYQIAIRMDSPAGFFAYNWFYNNTTGVVTPVPPTVTPGGPTLTPTTPAYTGIPTFSIQAVQRDVSVTILTNNFPPNQNFTVRMGPYGTAGVGGTVVGTTNSGAGGSFVETYAIPAGLAGSTRIAIRLESPQGYFAYNWFWNNTTGVVTPVPPTATVTPGGPTLTPTAPPYVGIPSFNIQSVVANTSVTILTNNFPPNQTFTVRMGAYGTAGVGGIVVTTTNSGAGGAFTETYAIPAALAGSSRIAIRLESPQGYYAYNWFWNNTTP
jgi:hypothetical protein